MIRVFFAITPHREIVAVFVCGNTTVDQPVGWYRDIDLHRTLASLDKDHWARLPRVYTGIPREINAVRVVRYPRKRGMPYGLWFPSIGHNVYSRGIAAEDAHHYYNDNKFWLAYLPEDSHYCPWYDPPPWAVRNAKARPPLKRPNTIVIVQSALEAWEVRTTGQLPAIPDTVIESSELLNPIRLLPGKCVDKAPCPIWLSRVCTFSSKSIKWDHIPICRNMKCFEWTIVPYVQTVELMCDTETAEVIVDLLILVGFAHPRARQLILYCNVNYKLLLKLRELFPNLQCVKVTVSTSVEPAPSIAESNVMGTEVFGTTWHPTQ